MEWTRPYFESQQSARKSISVLIARESRCVKALSLILQRTRMGRMCHPRALGGRVLLLVVIYLTLSRGVDETLRRTSTVCKKVDFGIDCTRVALREGVELDSPSDPNGTHVSSESPRRVSSPSRCDISHTLSWSGRDLASNVNSLQESRFRY